MRVRCICSTIIIIIFASTGLNGQVVLQSDRHIRSQSSKLPPEISSRALEPDTISISASQPFFDDFSHPTLRLDTSKWFIPEGSNRRSPQVNKHLAMRPPSFGAVVFDGLNEQGRPYNSFVLTSGNADSLVSHYLDLSGYGIADNIRLSFYLQPQGWGDAPEAVDSFFVYFISPSRQERVYARGGSGVSEFYSVIIPINKSEWFTTQFQIAFSNKGAQFGKLDLWHLDYVYLGLNRPANDTIFNDLSPTRLHNLATYPYTAIPAQHYNSLTPLMTDYEVEISNLYSNIESAVIKTEISDPLGGTVFQPIFSRDKTTNLSPQMTTEVSFDSFGEQSIDQIAQILHRVELSDISDTHPENDIIEQLIGIDSVLAYDDGEADTGFGLNKALAFGVRFDLEKEDSLSAVWISFVPTVNFNPVNNQTVYMEGRSFRLRIWDEPHPDSILYEQVGGMNVDYGEAPNSFIRFPFNSPQPVPKTFWIGIQQLDDKPLGVGYDLSIDHDSYTYWDSAGNWVNTHSNGTLMIRPETFNTAPLPSAISDQTLEPIQIRLFPNPSTANKVSVRFDLAPLLNGIYQARLINLQGQVVWQDDIILTGQNSIQLQLPAHIPPAMYIWEHIIFLKQKKTYIHREKFILQNPK